MEFRGFHVCGTWPNRASPRRAQARSASPSGTRSIWPSPAHATTKWSAEGVVFNEFSPKALFLMNFRRRRCFFNEFSPKALFFNEFSPKALISKALYLEINVSSDADFFEIEKLRLSAFQNGAFLLNFDLKTTSKGRFRIDY